MKRHLLIFRFPYESAQGMGGEERHVLSLVKGLNQRGHFVKVSTSCSCLLKRLKKHKYNHQKLWGGMDIVSKKALVLFPFTCVFVFLNLLFHLISQKSKHKIDTLYCLTLIEKILITPFARLLRIKVLWGQHTKPGRWIISNPFKFLFLWYSRFATLIVPSKDMQKQFVKIGVKEKNIQVIPNALDIESLPKVTWREVETFERTLLEYTEMKSDQQVKGVKFVKNATHKFFGDVKIVGSVARLSREKGIFDFVKAAAKLNTIHKNYFFYLVGEGDEKEKVEKMIKKENLQNTFFLLGYKDEEFLAQFLNVLDVFVLPSPYESFGIALLESLYYKCPIICARAGGMKDFVEQRKNGLMFTAHDSTDMAKSIEYMIEHKDLADKMVENGYNMVKKEYNLENVMDQWEGVLKEYT